jgi:hypothetical protein
LHGGESLILRDPASQGVFCPFKLNASLLHFADDFNAMYTDRLIDRLPASVPNQESRG